MAVALVTGGSRGIGAATALALASAGWDVAISYRERGDDAARVVAACGELGARATSVAADLADGRDAEHLLDAVGEELGTITGLVNNAGVVSPPGRVEAYDVTRVRRVVAINVVGAILVAGAAVRRMSITHGGDGGVIVNVSSRAAVLGSAGEYVDYAASKAAVDALTVGLAAEVAGEGIRVVGVRPGLIETEIHVPGRLDRLGPTTPLGRAGLAEEVAAAIVWLMSPGASYVTGATLDVSGGR